MHWLLCLFLISTSVQPEDPSMAKQRAIEHLVLTQQADGSWVLPGLERYNLAGSAYFGFALIQAGLPKDHVAIRRIDSLLRSTSTRSTYDAAARVLFFDALAPPDLEALWPEFESLLAVPRHGYYGYRMTGSTQHGDLSNHQFALMALEVLNRHGRGPDEEEWLELASFLIKQQTPTGGWDYFAGKSAVNPSMTLAGAACLGACRLSLSRLNASPKQLREIDQSLQRALQEVEDDWYLDLSRDRAPLHRWIHYANSTMERLGYYCSSHIPSDWNWESAVDAFLVQTQRPNGTWSSGKGEPMLNTAMALATLSRATAETGRASSGSWIPKWSHSDSDFTLIANGLDPCNAFVVMKDRESKLKEVRWSLDGKPLGDGVGARGAIQFKIARNGEYELLARIETDDGSQSRELSLTVSATTLYDAQEVGAHKRRGRSLDLYDTAWGNCKGSSAIGNGFVWALDGSLATSWRPKKGDDQPTWSCHLPNAVRHRGVLIELLPTDTEVLREFPLKDWIELRLDGKKSKKLEWDPSTGGILCEANRSLKTSRIEVRLSMDRIPTAHRVSGIAEVRFLAR